MFKQTYQSEIYRKDGWHFGENPIMPKEWHGRKQVDYQNADDMSNAWKELGFYRWFHF